MKTDEFAKLCADDDSKETRHEQWFRQIVYVTIAILGYLLFAAVTILYVRLTYFQPVSEFIRPSIRPSICDCNTSDTNRRLELPHIRRKRSIENSNQQQSYPIIPRPQECFANNETYYTNVPTRFTMNMDALINPCDDFYRYACGNYRNPFFLHQPPALVTAAEEDNNRNLLKVVQALAKTPDEDLPKGIKFAIAFFDVCKNPPPQPKRLPIIDWITDNVGQWPLVHTEWSPKDTKIDIWTLVARIQGKFSLQSLLTANVDSDHPASDRNYKQILIGITSKTALTYASPFRNYFNATFLQAEYYRFIQTAANAYVVKGQFLNSSQSMFTEITNLIAFERKIAEASIESSKNVTEKVNDYETMKIKFDAINWDEYMSELIEHKPRQIIVYNENYLERMNTIIEQTDIRTLYSYAIWQLARAFSWPADPFSDNSPNGIKLQLPKKDCFAKLTEEMPVAVNWLLWNTTEQGLNLTRLFDMVDEIKHAYMEHLDLVADIDESTRTAAKAKLNAAILSIGQLRWQTNRTAIDEYYADLAMPESADEFNINIAIKRWEWKQLIKRIDTTVDRGFELVPLLLAQSNAAYYATQNSQLLYHGFLQRRYYYQRIPDAILFGELGNVIAHEFAHAFDPNGIQYDRFGNKGDVWLSERDHIQFLKSVDAMIAKFDEAAFACSRTNSQPYRINGTLVINEVIADHVGIKVALRALQRNRNKVTTIEDAGFSMFTKEQLYFLAFANRFCKDKSADWIDAEFKDQHPPDAFRVNIALQNFPEFAETFHCPVGSAMNPIDKANVW